MFVQNASFSSRVSLPVRSVILCARRRLERSAPVRVGPTCLDSVIAHPAHGHCAFWAEGFLEQPSFSTTSALYEAAPSLVVGGCRARGIGYRAVPLSSTDVSNRHPPARKLAYLLKELIGFSTSTMVDMYTNICTGSSPARNGTSLTKERGEWRGDEGVNLHPSGAMGSEAGLLYSE